MSGGRVSVRGSELTFRVRLTPRGGRDAVEAWSAGVDGAEHLKARVSKAPEDGEANAALIALLAETFDLPKTRVRIAAGETARLKTIAIAAGTPELAARIARYGDAA